MPGSVASVARKAPDAPAKVTSPPVQRHAGASRPAASTKSKVPAPTAATASVAQPAVATVGTASGYYINVGLFADEANARKAQARLLNEGIPAFRQELNNANGRRIRVRVGPYDSRAAANAAAASIRAMELDAVVFKQ
jgi:cell division septation protein DedD